MTKKLGKILSLFCGCGGLDLGFEQVGYETALAYDQRKDAVSSWNRNRAEANSRVRDIRELTLEQIDQDFGREFHPTGIIGGPPCQGFSIANRNGSDKDPRNTLVSKFFDIALKLHDRNPVSFIAMENVPPIQGQRGGGIIDEASARLVERGFNVNCKVLDAVNYQVPQRRKRFFLVAIPKTAAKSGWIPPEPYGQKETVRSAIGDFPEPAIFQRGWNSERNPFHENHWCMMPKSKKFFDGTLVEGFTENRSFKTLWWDQPSYTASYGNREVHIHPNGKRRLSVFEAMTLQGFPRWFVLNGSMSSQITQVSEAVPPPLAYAVAKSLGRSLNS
ncbi:Cytosine-specific methyltransferase [Sulfitobacter noctilucae]|uniref:DNA cytosine methyltransferase n=1 Tax=Sulfitobacter noctilucae TaxID=1342302 RepID=UPI000468A734|nr:DNA cytosine methyltransferase [Sulfitobacter noctilucae]KIN65541.1 Cytosine-specific methyltransferase [Sulfitobacter noctilucae]